MSFLPKAYATAADVTVWSQYDQLTTADAEFLKVETAKLDFPEQVTQVHYLLFTKNDDNLNDNVRQYAIDNNLLNASRDKYAPGTLFISVGLRPQRNGVHCGDDVCAALGLNSEGKIEQVNSAAHDALRNKRYAAGMFESAKTTLVVGEASAEDEFTKEDGFVIAGFLGLGAILTAGGVHKHRKRKLKDTAVAFDFVSKNYGDAAQDLDATNIRAHSLSSPLVNDTLRKEWDEVRSNFLNVHEQYMKLPDLNTSDPKTLRKYSKEILAMQESLEQLNTAESNIDSLYELEHGNTDERRSALNQLRTDVKQAGLQTTKYKSEIAELTARLEATDPLDKEFMDAYVLLLGDAKQLFDAIAAENEMELESGQPPRIYDDTWRPGVGYNGFVTWTMMDSWHQSSMAANNVDTSYSSSSFSGGGGSSSW